MNAKSRPAGVYGNAHQATIPVRVKVGLAFVALVACFAGFLYVFYPARLAASGLLWAERRATGIASLLARAAAPSLDFDSADGARDLLASLSAADGALYGAIRRQDGSVLAAFRPEHAPNRPLPEVGRGERTNATLVDGSRLYVVTTIAGAAGSRGTLVLSFSLAELERDKAHHRAIAVAVSLLVALMAVVLALGLGAVVVRPVEALTRAVTSIMQTGDLTKSVQPTSRDELGTLAWSFREMVAQLASVMKTSKEQIRAVTGAVEQLSRVGSTVSAGSAAIGTLVADSSGLIRRVQESIDRVDGDVLVLQRSGEHGSNAIMEMARGNDVVATKIGEMAAAVEQTAGVVRAMAVAMQNIAKSIGEVTDALADTSSAMVEVDASTASVDKAALRTAELADAVCAKAGVGVQALDRTMEGIHRIEGAAQSARKVIADLTERVADIDTIVEVIDDVAEETTILALNATIIAAQAGPHGRGFSVVADEIRTLAERTSASTQEIAMLIARVRRESDKAILAMQEGVRSVDDGVTRGRAASAALAEIDASSREAAQMVSSIARATAQQAESTGRIAQAVQRITTTALSISATANEQEMASRAAIESTDAMHASTSAVQFSCRQQTARSADVLRAIDEIQKVVGQVSASQTEQTATTALVLDAVAAISDVSGGQGAAVTDLETAIGSLRDQTGALCTVLQHYDG